ncbi:MAG: glycosyltransferase [Planctomycetota bacterium]
MSDKIWLYWEGPMPEYISLCCETVFVHNDNVELLDRDSFDTLFVRDRDLNIDKLDVVHRSDFVRAYILTHYGGLYIDADCIVMRNLSPVFDMSQQVGFVGYRDPLGYMSCNFMASSNSSNIMKEFYSKICSIIREDRPLDWLDIGSTPMNDVIACCENESALLPTEAIMPLAWNDSKMLMVQRSDEEQRQNFNETAFCYMLSNNTIRSHDETRTLHNMSKDQLLNSKYFISFLFREALKR